MANVLINENSMTAIANAIRSKNGTQTRYKPAQMADAISAISGGGSTPTGTKQITITENGTTTEDVSAYANAQITVNVAGGGSEIDAYLGGTVTTVTSNLATVKGGALNGQTNLTSISFPNLTEISQGMCENCTNLTSASIPSVTYVNTRGFSASGLPSICIPKAQLGANAFLNCKSLVTAVFKSFGSYDGQFNGCSKLQAADIVNPSGIRVAFQNCSVLNTLVLRYSGVYSLRNTTVFNGSPFASGGTGGTIYIPKALYDHLGDGTSDDYKADTNWATYDGYGTITWAPIEGSIYENQYVDGTAIAS